MRLSCLAEPLSEATLTVIPNPPHVSEGEGLLLICGVKGSPPITFRWYRSDQEKPLYTTMVNSNNSHFQITHLSQGHSGSYHCEAINYANDIHSDTVKIQGETGRRTTATHSALTVQRPLQLEHP